MSPQALEETGGTMPAYDKPLPELYEAQERTRKAAEAALASSDTRRTSELARQMLQTNTAPRDWNYGNVVHEANQLLGIAALQEGRTEDAKR